MEATLNQTERHPVLGSTLGGVAVLLFGTLTASLAHSSGPCVQIDRTVASRLAPMLDSGDPGDAKIIYRAIITLKTAREYCDRGWTEEALTLYRTLEARIETYRRIGMWREE
jgi:hypothetical protein